MTLMWAAVGTPVRMRSRDANANQKRKKELRPKAWVKERNGQRKPKHCV